MGIGRTSQASADARNASSLDQTVTRRKVRRSPSTRSRRAAPSRFVPQATNRSRPPSPLIF